MNRSARKQPGPCPRKSINGCMCMQNKKVIACTCIISRSLHVLATAFKKCVHTQKRVIGVENSSNNHLFFSIFFPSLDWSLGLSSSGTWWRLGLFQGLLFLGWLLLFGRSCSFGPFGGRRSLVIWKIKWLFCALGLSGGWGCLLVGALTFQVKSFKLGFPLRRCGQDWFQEGQGPTDWVCSKVSEQIMKLVLLVVKTCKNNHKIETNINKSYGRCYRAKWEGSIPSNEKAWMWCSRSRHDPRSANLAPVTILKIIFHSKVAYLEFTQVRPNLLS